MINMPFIPTFPVFFQLLPFCCESESNSLNVGTKEIFSGRILKFGRHFERVEKKIRFLHARSWPFTSVRARAYGGIFF